MPPIPLGSIRLEAVWPNLRPMSDSVTIDQLRTFITVVDEGTFSAAGRRLSRTQSAISYTLATLEAQLGVQLFDRNGRTPVLTQQGRALIEDARSIAGSMDLFQGRAKGLTCGLEAELSVVFDAMFPIGELTGAAGDFQAQFPMTRLQLHVEPQGAILQSILEKRCAFGVVATIELSSTQFVQERLMDVRMMAIAAPTHPLASHAGPIAIGTAERYTEIVLADRLSPPGRQARDMLTAKAWGVGDLSAKLAFLKAGLGWGSMPQESIAPDLEQGTLVPLSIEGTGEGGTLPMSAIYHAAQPPGQAGRWLIDRLRR